MQWRDAKLLPPQAESRATENAQLEGLSVRPEKRLRAIAWKVVVEQMRWDHLVVGTEATGPCQQHKEVPERPLSSLWT